MSANSLKFGFLTFLAMFGIVTALAFGLILAAALYVSLFV